MSRVEPLLEIMRRLRDPETGCPWDLQQSYQSLVPHTLEECYEVAETIEQGELHNLPDELGDLLFQIVFYAQLGAEESRFDFNTVVEHICDKLIRRHPHVFADAEVNSAEDQTRAWETHKQKERQAKAADHETAGALSGVSTALPALSRAGKLQRRAARVGFDWPELRGVIDKVHEELQELEDELNLSETRHPSRIEEEFGDLLFSCVNLARHLELDAERALRQANRKFEQRFQQVERLLESDGGIEKATLEEMDAAWEKAKSQLPPQG